MPKFFTTKKTVSTLAEVNMIPLVDIVFTLLIIFMILSPMLHKGIEVQIPESSEGENVPDQQQHIVSITREGTLWLDAEETSLDRLQEQLGAFDSTETIYVRSDKSVSYGQVVEVISAIKAGGFRNVGLVTTPQGPKSAGP